LYKFENIIGSLFFKYILHHWIPGKIYNLFSRPQLSCQSTAIWIDL